MNCIRSLPFTCALLAFLQCFYIAFATTQTLVDIDQQQRHRRQVRFSPQIPRSHYQNRSYTDQPTYPEYGPWGPWTESSQCSRTCGGGVAYQDRICMDVRADGRHSCVGRSRRYFSCNIEDCPSGTKDFRAEQCARFNSVPYKGKYYGWLPYYSPHNPCELTCMPRGGSFYARLDSKVIDGTRCYNDGSLDVCVDAQCMPVGCDKILGSTMREDECRVCGGDGSSCRVIRGVFDGDDFESGYNDILLIPTGATSILIQEVKHTNNFLAIRNTAGLFYLNGNWKIESPREIRFAGTLFHYERKPQGYLAPEILKAKGPTSEPIFIVLLYQETNLGISYEYSVPISTKSPQPDSYSWTHGDFEECSQTCGGGIQYRPVRCARKSDNDIVDENLCDPLLKPEANSSCNIQPCPSGWQIGEWSNCSHSCGGGTQFRLVFCHQRKEGNAILLADEMCEQPKPLFMRSCNTDKECPDWEVGEWSECDSSCGSGNQTRSVECHSKDSGEVIEDSFCDSNKKPDNFQNCNLGPCEGVEWIVSDWSGCDGFCSPRMESREAHCANEEGVIFPNDACETNKMPELSRPCPMSTMCEPMWHTSEWTECSAKCGNGVQSRLVFCGAWQDGTVIKIEDKMCDPEKKVDDVQNCTSDSCKGVWLIGPWNICSVPCGGGERTRKIFCYHEDSIVDASQCDPTEQPFDKETCNMKPCDDDEIMDNAECKNSKYGCCPDGMTSSGPNYEGCPKLNISSTNTSCEEAEYGCCADNFTLALGPFKKGCPVVVNCNISQYGCCPDEKTPSVGPNFEGCIVEESDCGNSTFGCCLDGFTTATGPDFEGCFIHESNCSNSTYGCCPDGMMAASGFEFEGCFPDDSNCSNSTFGCCLDGFTTATGPDFEGCFIHESNCSNSTYGCCPDGMTAASGFEFEGCFPDDSNCSNSTYGCCSDGMTAALGFNNEGCEENVTEPFDMPDVIFDGSGSGEDCYSLKYGCCPDGISPASGPDQEGCEAQGNETDCKTSAFGCCEDGVTSATGPWKSGCPEDESSGDGDMLGPCEDTVFGCCPDNFTIAKGFEGEGCEDLNCSSSTFGCCPDNTTTAKGPNGEGCYPDDCSNSTFGCCPNNTTAAKGPNGEGCYPEDCSNSTFGCCPDDTTAAKGPDGEGCYSDECSDSMFGCCPDNITTAEGPDGEGCYPEDCSNSTFGCCPDNITSALGLNGEGCYEVSCDNTMFGCCPDNITIAEGPNGEGCFPEDCINSTFGCCADNITVALGPDREGCGPEHCFNSTFGCCPDNVTLALGPNNEGCISDDCINTTFGCCPDNSTIALGPGGEGCDFENCVNTTFGCCPDNVTIATGPGNLGCDINCVNNTYGCCPDNMTSALGPENEGCDLVIIDCYETEYGCCQDNTSVAAGPNFEGCENATDCMSSSFGCCPDNITFATGPNLDGCNITEFTTEPEEITTTEMLQECVNTMFGCCPDEVTTALGPNLEGCCFGMRFGCCPDNKTAALGPTFLGCGCQTYPYRCCPDGITPAQGFNNKGCKCEHFQYGCCQDKITPAKGPHFEGCVCQLMYYGCCPDGITPVTSATGEGCGCDSTRYGCCPDGKTAAVSADLSGCPCDTLPYGCCPDGHTPARTSDLRDCPCEAQRYGCCLDGRTFAKGPNYEGCPCESTRFGCCLDGKTTAQGPDFQGCPCETTRYGCCADGYTAAEGPHYEGCPDVLQPKPKVSTEVCSLPKEPGPCRNFTVKWFFDTGYGGCSRFWYGGCDGNGNVFNTREECEATCVKPEGPEVCLLPKVAGSCEDKIPSWYHDAGSQSCEPFTYGGCLGNSNRFVTKTDCELKCVSQQPVKPVDKCSLPKDEGSCNNQVITWYYNKENSRCERFYYGGCKGNENRFDSREECEKSCIGTVTHEIDICHLPQEVGKCTEFRERWYFDYASGQCHRFFYGGCSGNENNFASFYECEKQCGKDTSVEPVDLEFRTEYCFLSQDPGPCTNVEGNWYYDSSDGVCKEFYYGGCKGNRNRFKTRKECEVACFKAQDVCSLAAVKGPCSGSFTQWYYDKSQDDCFEFLFGGCQGNANRFNSKEMCHQRCKKEPLTTKMPLISDDVCTLLQEPGPCLGYYRMWYYDGSDNMCKSFVYGGCDGNENRFTERSECEQRCVKKIAKEPPVVPEPSKITNEDVCRLTVDPGPCNEALPRWFYDAQTQNCLKFVYGGCGGNKNRFKTSEMCLRFCTGIKAKTEIKEMSFTTPLEIPLTTVLPTQCPPSNCSEIRCPYGIEQSFDTRGCSTCRCSNPCEVHTCPEGSRCAIDVVRTSQEGVRTEPVCRRVQKSGLCPSVDPSSSAPTNCETYCRDDADCKGEHKCCNNGCAFTCMAPADDSQFPGTQPEPAQILPGVNVTEGRIGEPAELPCSAIGWPKPTVTWWRDTTMLPLSSHRYEQLQNYALLIRSVVYEDRGEYKCHAHNGIGSGATYKVTLIIDLSLKPLPFPHSDDNDFSARDSEPVLVPDIPKTPVENVPLVATVNLVTHEPTSGFPVQIDCRIESPEHGIIVKWYHNNNQLLEDDRKRILSNHTLFITKADVSDSGEYRCTVSHNSNSASSSVYMTVKVPPTESSCVDSPQFNNCEIIVKARYCNNKYYGKFCCGSCLKAGQLQEVPLA